MSSERFNNESGNKYGVRQRTPTRNPHDRLFTDEKPPQIVDLRYI